MPFQHRLWSSTFIFHSILCSSLIKTTLDNTRCNCLKPKYTSGHPTNQLLDYYVIQRWGHPFLRSTYLRYALRKWMLNCWMLETWSLSSASHISKPRKQIDCLSLIKESCMSYRAIRWLVSDLLPNAVTDKKSEPAVGKSGQSTERRHQSQFWEDHRQRTRTTMIASFPVMMLVLAVAQAGCPHSVSQLKIL